MCVNGLLFVFPFGWDASVSGLIWVLEPGWVRRHDVGLGFRRVCGRSIYQGPPAGELGTGGWREPTAGLIDDFGNRDASSGCVSFLGGGFPGDVT